MSQSPDDRVLVVGSYPPIPLPAARATVAAVRRAWADGDEVTVVSPRLSAADLAVPVAGVLAGRRLTNLRRHTAATRLVVVMEAGMPVPVLGPGHLVGRPVGRYVGWLRQWLTIEAIRPALSGFDHITFVRVGDLAICPWLEARLLGPADDVIDHLASTLDSPEALGVTVLGPVEVPPRQRPRQIAGAVTRRLLGPYAGPLRARAGAIRRSLRR